MDGGRQQRGLEIAALSRVIRVGDAWQVPSQSGNGKYIVRLGECPRCTCLDNETNARKCKHIYAVEYVIQREMGEEPQAETPSANEQVIAAERRSYSQDWPAYNKAQTNEKREFQILLRDLCQGLAEPERKPGQRGRPSILLADAVFAAVFKVYSTFSGRRFMSDLQEARSKGYVNHVPHFNSIFNFLETVGATSVLMSLIERSSLPLISVESDFAVDSTGFMSSRFDKWFDQKYGKVRQEHTWVKAHVCCGVKTNIITAVEIHDRFTADGPLLPSLVDATARNFTMREVSADKGYLSIKNMEAISAHGAEPFIAFKRNSKEGAGGPLWDKMYHFFNFHRSDYLGHYHKRSNVESTMMMVKSKFGDSVRSKGDMAMKNEVLAKILCHNIVCVIHAMYELGIDPVFGQVA